MHTFNNSSGIARFFQRAYIQYVFNYQSQSIEFSEWLSLFTLCLAPLVAHILIGVPEPVVLRGPRPTWTDRICHFKPTSIYWRYYIITARRVGSKSWDSADMAASNAVFWTGPKTRWDGSKNMMKQSRTFCTRLPAHNRTSILSGSSIKTVLAALQGAQAISTLCVGWRSGHQALSIALPTIFLPCAIFGLFRLPAALWLSDEYGYADIGSWDACVISELLESPRQIAELPDRIQRPPSSTWRSIAVKILYIAPLIGLLALLVLYFVPLQHHQVWTITDLVTQLFYLCFLLTTITSTLIHMVRNQTDSTIFPSVDKTWYTCYTVVLYLLALVYLIFASLETRRTPCGEYTTFPAQREFDDKICTPR
ncbi:hypothetical protein F5882DRAFT_477998 [Hyaloscypha sp. PMI_1271]|nr:hypothetical protein F5882DRAFT_477998 [Hyaloscypha sp. PMI_1271]